jgi:hypothetical protein
MDLGKWLALQWDRIAAWASVIAGATALIVGWTGVSGTAYLSEQIPYIVSGGIGGMFLLGLGGMLWLSADLRDEWYKLDRVEEELRLTREAGISPLPGTAPGGSAAASSAARPEFELMTLHNREAAGA